MKVWRDKWQQIGQRFDTKTPRERALLAAAAVGGTILLGNLLWLDPLLVRSRQVQRQLDQQKQEAQMLTDQAAALTAQVRSDPDALKKARANRLKTDLAGVESELNALALSFISPEEMELLLEKLLAGYPRLRLISLKSLPPVNLAEAGGGAAAQASQPGRTATAAAGGGAVVDTVSAVNASAQSAPSSTPSGKSGLFRHGVEVRLEGSYSDLHAWLAQIEAAQQKLLWGGVRLSVVEHPRARIVLTIYTLSTDKTWLAI